MDLTPLVEAYLLIDQPRQRIGHWTAALAPLDAPIAPPLAQVVAYYDPTCDQALLRLRYDELALGPTRLEYVVEVALLAEIGMIQPAVLSDVERRRVLVERLARCTHHVDGRGAVQALVELAKRLRAVRVAGSLHREPRGDTLDPLLLEPPHVARGTRDDIEKLQKPVATPPPLPPETPALGRPAKSHRHVVARSSRATTKVGDPNDHSGDNDRETIAMAPLDKSQLAQLGKSPLAKVPSLPALATSPALTPKPARPMPPPIPRPRAGSPTFPPDPEPAGPATIYARYLRSGKWIPIRVGALSLKGAALMTGALPRLHDHVDIAFAYGTHRALVRSAVTKVSTTREAAATGAATFSVAFQLDAAARGQLVGLLTAARKAKVTIKPPPARAAQRFPVEWPVSLGAIQADALDISENGLFVRSAPLELGAVLDVTIVAEDGAPIAARCKVVRELGEREARACGLAPGFGLAIVDVAGDGRARWDAFVARIARRAVKRVLVGASMARLAQLQAALASAGYAVIGGSDPGALVQLANADTRPVDAALIDGAWLGVGSATWVENLFSARAVPCVTVNGDVRKARTAVDRLLQVNRA